MTSPYLKDHAGATIGERAIPEDDPLSDLKQLEMNLRDGMCRAVMLNLALVSSLGRDGVDIDVYVMLDNIYDVISDHLGLEMMRLENNHADD